MLLKPAPGLAVRDPELRDLLPEEGRDVPRSEYWLRRIADGDVVDAAPQPAAAPQMLETH
jgi:hypothetical protein